MNEIPYGYCHCGCGQKTNIATRTSTKKGWIKGEPLRFIKYHHSIFKNQSMDKNPQWKGGKTNRRGRSVVKIHGHPMSDKQGYVNEARLIVSNALGKVLPPDSVAHHHDKNPNNNDNSNLVLCNDRSYHKLLHIRANALQDCGNPEFRKCSICKQYDDTNNLYKNRSTWIHIECAVLYNKQRRERVRNNKQKTI